MDFHRRSENILPKFAAQYSSVICEVTSSGRPASSSLPRCGAAAGRWNTPCGSGFRASLSEGSEVAGLQRTRALLRLESPVAGWTWLTSHRTRLSSDWPMTPPSEVQQKNKKQTQLASRIPHSWIYTLPLLQSEIGRIFNTVKVCSCRNGKKVYKCGS